MQIARTVSIAFFLAGAALSWGAWQLGLGSARVPEPGLYPMILGLSIMAISAILLFVEGETSSEESPASKPQGHRLETVVTLLALVLFILIVRFVGFAVSSVILLAILFWNGGIRGAYRIVFLSITIGVAAEIGCRLIGIPVPEPSLLSLLRDGL